MKGKDLYPLLPHCSFFSLLSCKECSWDTNPLKALLWLTEELLRFYNGILKIQIRVYKRYCYLVCTLVCWMNCCRLVMQTLLTHTSHTKQETCVV